MSKSVTFNTNPRNKPQPDAKALDAFVQGGEGLLANASETARAKTKVPMKRLTFDIAADLHKRIRMACLERDKEMAEEIRRILNENFPTKP